MPQAFEAADLLQHQHITDISCSWDQSLVACCLGAVNQAADSATSTLWIYPTNGEAPWQLTSGTSYDNHPRWSPDGRQLGFISDRANPPQLFVIARDGGEARQLGTLPGSATGFEWSPDGRSLLVVVSLRVDPALRGARPAPDAGEPPKDGPQVVWRLPSRATAWATSSTMNTICSCSTPKAARPRNSPTARSMCSPRTIRPTASASSTRARAKATHRTAAISGS